MKVRGGRKREEGPEWKGYECGVKEKEERIKSKISPKVQSPPTDSERFGFGRGDEMVHVWLLSRGCGCGSGCVVEQ